MMGGIAWQWTMQMGHHTSMTAIVESLGFIGVCNACGAQLDWEKDSPGLVGVCNGNVWALSVV
jgi:hypothetical protein